MTWLYYGIKRVGRLVKSIRDVYKNPYNGKGMGITNHSTMVISIHAGFPG
jgi:hypothetical protein